MKIKIEKQMHNYERIGKGYQIVFHSLLKLSSLCILLCCFFIFLQFMIGVP